MRPKRHPSIVRLPYALHRRIFPSSQSNQPVSKFSSPNMLGLAYNRASSSSPPPQERGRHGIYMSEISHVSLLFHSSFDGQIKTSISNILGRDLSPRLDWRIATALSKDEITQHRCWAPSQALSFFCEPCCVGGSTRGGVHRPSRFHCCPPSSNAMRERSGGDSTASVRRVEFHTKGLCCSEVS